MASADPASIKSQDRSFEGALQTAWDRDLSAKPILLILVGSDLSVMDALTSYGRPFFGRAPKMTVSPLHLGDVAAMTGLGAVDAIDALLLTGGFPEITQSWSPGMTRRDFLRESLSCPLSPFPAAGELTVSGEYNQLARDAIEVPGVTHDTPLAAVSRSGFADNVSPAATWHPEDLLRAWQ